MIIPGKSTVQDSLKRMDFATLAEYLPQSSIISSLTRATYPFLRNSTITFRCAKPATTNQRPYSTKSISPEIRSEINLSGLLGHERSLNSETKLESCPITEYEKILTDRLMEKMENEWARLIGFDVLEPDWDVLASSKQLKFVRRGTVRGIYKCP